MHSRRQQSRDAETPSTEETRLSPESIQLLLNEPDDDRVLAVLEDGDPIALVEQCRAWADRWSFILDEDDLIVHARARIVLDRSTFDKNGAVDDWIDDRISFTASALMSRDEQLVLDKIPIERPLEPRFAALATALGLDIAHTRKACVVANGLSDDLRPVFYNLIYKKRNLQEYAKQMGSDLASVGTALRRALYAVSLMNDEGYDPLKGKGQ